MVLSRGATAPRKSCDSRGLVFDGDLEPPGGHRGIRWHRDLVGATTPTEGCSVRNMRLLHAGSSGVMSAQDAQADAV
jgi:hypothetical protein